MFVLEIILPNADFKFFITASAEERARRRMRQLSLPENEYENILKEIKDRDKRDSERKLSPLKIAKDAHYIDNTNLTVDETINQILAIINKK
jgi:cytidylate kinase